ncbi:MAG: hypothetical protein ACFFE8_17255 [Candidatus Heimdallarchaeota archaeon]
MARNYQQDFEAWAEIERVKMVKFQHKGEQNHGVWPRSFKGHPMTLEEVLAQAEEKYVHLTSTQLRQHRMTHGHCVVSKY